MPKIKMKTHRGAAKRFKLLKSGKIKRSRAGKRHILNKKDRKRKRTLRQGTYVSKVESKNIRRLLPFQ